MVLVWAEKWLKLIGLINEVTGAPEPPADLDELQYQNLRFWFVDHQEEFGRLWGDFHEYWISCQDYSSENTGDRGDMDKYLENPFLYFYEPENLYQLAQHLELQSSTDLWEPSEHEASMIRPVLVRLGNMMLEFTDWVKS